MLRRLAAVIRSFFGLFIRGLEDPERMLNQYMDELRARVPKMNDTVAEVMKTEILLRNQMARLEKEIAELDKQVIAAVKLGPQYEDEARTLISALETKKENLEDTKEQWESAQRAAEQAKRARDDFRREMDKKIQEAMQAISKSKQAQMQEQLSGLMMTFQEGDQSDVLQRMTERIDERAAKAQARVELATSGVDARLRDVRRASAEIGVDDKLQEYKRQLGMLPEEPAAERTMGPVAEAQTETPPPQPQTAQQG